MTDWLGVVRRELSTVAMGSGAMAHDDGELRAVELDMKLWRGVGRSRRCWGGPNWIGWDAGM